MPTSTTPRANTVTIDTPTGAGAPVSLGRSSSRGGGLLCWTLLLALAGCDSLTKANGGDGGEGGNNDPDLQDNDNDGVVARDDCDDDDPNIKEKSDWFVDKDGDGHGSDADTVEACYSPTGYAAENDDCNDAASTIFPGADEVCNGVDDDCDSAIDDSDDDVTDPLTWFPDGDDDGFGTDEGSVVACLGPSGHVADGGDCDDTIPEVNPGVAEVCNNGLDDDCDGDPGDCALDAQFELSDERPGLQGSSSGDFAGWSVSAAGDINADGLNDVLVGAPYNDRADYNGGATYLVYGTVTSWTLSEDAAAAWYGEAEEEQLGWAVSGPGDLNGDGADDIAIGVPNQDGPGGGNAGGARRRPHLKDDRRQCARARRTHGPPMGRIESARRYGSHRRLARGFSTHAADDHLCRDEILHARLERRARCRSEATRHPLRGDLPRSGLDEFLQGRRLREFDRPRRSDLGGMCGRSRARHGRISPSRGHGLEAQDPSCLLGTST